jgi:hypothetical protein
MIIDDRPDKEGPTSYTQEHKYPDPEREVYKFDWETNEYVYKDEVDMSRPKDTPMESYPDFTVRIEGQTQGRKVRGSSSSYANKTIEINGKRYKARRINERNVELIEIK